MPELSSVFSLVNYAFVLFFGIVASLYFADIGFCDHKRVYVLTLFFFGIAQLLFYLIMGESVLYKCYPFLIHLPLILLIFLRFHRNLSISAISVCLHICCARHANGLAPLLLSFLTEIPLYRTLPPSLLPFRFLFL